PHRLQRPTRPDWFFDPEAFGGIIVDIAPHQVDQFLFYPGSTTGEVIASSIGKAGMPVKPAFEEFGEVRLGSDKAAG
ncbi:gfo/Idh/MocA family oxidoreductase, partial [Rhizobium ruizarguesonis]